MSQLAHKFAGPDASFADCEMILQALRMEVMVQVRASIVREGAGDVEGMTVPRAVPTASRSRPAAAPARTPGADGTSPIRRQPGAPVDHDPAATRRRDHPHRR